MKKLNLIFILCLFLPEIYAQSPVFEGVIEYTILFKHDPDYLKSWPGVKKQPMATFAKCMNYHIGRN